MWQALYEELGARGFVVIAVAMDSREGDPLPWIEAARPTYPTLIDREHRLAELYGIVNVPQAVWIDEAGRIVRPAESAGAYEGFRKMNRATREMPEDVARLTAQAKATYLDAIRDWVRAGGRSEHAFTAEQARAHLPAVTADGGHRAGHVPPRPVPARARRERGGPAVDPGGEPAPARLLVHLAPGRGGERDRAWPRCPTSGSAWTRSGPRATTRRST